jgi:MoxR-like ATPase
MSITPNDVAKKIIANVEKAIVGKRKQLVLSLVSWFSGGHILLEDVPGVAKTMLARALAHRSVHLRSEGERVCLSSWPSFHPDPTGR